MRVETEAERDALAVPVGALLALAGGGYALEVVRRRPRASCRVEVGAFADGYVQVDGRGHRRGHARRAGRPVSVLAAQPA